MCITSFSHYLKIAEYSKKTERGEGQLSCSTVLCQYSQQKAILDLLQCTYDYTCFLRSPLYVNLSVFVCVYIVVVFVTKYTLALEITPHDEFVSSCR